MIALIDYGCGNIQAFAHIYKRLNIPFRVVKSENELANIKKIILPGVGSFDWAMAKLNESGLREELDELLVEWISRKFVHQAILGLGASSSCYRMACVTQNIHYL